MEKNETAKFERVGSFFIFFVLGLEVGLPFLISLSYVLLWTVLPELMYY